MIIVEGRVRMAPGEVERFRPAALDMIAKSRQEAGCISYAYAIDVAEPDVVRIIERWRDQAALDAHNASPHMADFSKTLAQVKMLEVSVKSYTAELAATLIGD